MAFEWFVTPSGYALIWWSLLVTFAGVTSILFVVAWWKTRKFPYDKAVARWSRRYSMGVRLLAVPFVFECVWRSVFPALYNRRQTFFDTQLNAVLLNRLLAFVGEVCWATQIAWALVVLASNMPLRPGAPRCLIRKFVPVLAAYMCLQALASNICATIGLATTNNLYTTIEEAGWLLIFFVGSSCAALILWWGCDAGLFGDDDSDGVPNVFDKHVAPSTRVMRFFLRGMVLTGLTYVPYMAIIDVPKYYGRWQEQVAAGTEFLSIQEGFVDGWQRRFVTQDWDDWKEDWVWQSFYFSTGAWAAIALMFAPGRLEVRSDTVLPTGGPIIESSTGSSIISVASGI